MDWDVLMEIVLTAVIVPLLTWGVSVLIKFLNAKIEQVTNATLNEALASATAELESAVNASVAETQQTFVAALKEEGPLTKEQAKQAFDMAFERTKQIMSESAMEIFEIMGKSINEMITAQIEKAVWEL